MRAGVINLMIEYARSNSFDYEAHMAAAAVAFHLQERSGMDLIMRYQALQYAHEAIISIAAIRPGVIQFDTAHVLIHQLIQAVKVDLEKRGVKMFEKPPPPSEDEDAFLAKHAGDFEEWAEQLNEKSEESE
jgi:hypothetical protein